MNYTVRVTQDGGSYKNDSDEIVSYKTDHLDIPALVKYLGENSQEAKDKVSTPSEK